MPVVKVVCEKGAMVGLPLRTHFDMLAQADIVRVTEIRCAEHAYDKWPVRFCREKESIFLALLERVARLIEFEMEIDAVGFDTLGDKRSILKMNIAVVG